MRHFALEMCLLIALFMTVGCDSKEGAGSQDRRKGEAASLGLDIDSITEAFIHSLKRGRVKLDEQNKASVIVALKNTEQMGPAPPPKEWSAPQPEVFLELVLSDGSQRRFGILGGYFYDSRSKANWPFEFGKALLILGGCEVSNP